MQEMQETWFQRLETYSSIFVWKMRWTDELSSYSPWGHKDSDMIEQLSTHVHT